MKHTFFFFFVMADIYEEAWNRGPLGKSVPGLKTFMNKFYLLTCKNIIHDTKILSRFCELLCHDRESELNVLAFSGLLIQKLTSRLGLQHKKSEPAVQWRISSFIAVSNYLWWKCKQLHQNKNQGTKVCRHNSKQTQIQITVYLIPASDCQLAEITTTHF